ncbi:hypothetical protein PRIPAC_93470 [Pristionchus pacificus]|uniref:Uncharacterized protein n=1 Tax=Pristionchus pacificus TaxID=54126 RepID=A0A2A6BPL8_PRIPA|nr:hypothetical protein PRIPAC_93470 [Pristionchus pacificus]|eukprot:PDM67845.1 hypothetical protein PRIPAC_45889 [Pristionchus pacificus]
MELSTLRNRNERQLNSSDEMLLHFQKESPVGLSIYKKLNAFVDGKMKEYRFGQEAIAFIKSLERTQLFFAAWGYNELAGRYVAGTEREGKVLIRKAVSAYLALSETAKNDLEKMWCIRTFYQTLTFLEATGNIRIMREILRD